MADPKLPGIYAIRNTVNGKCYVGSAVNIALRWKLHRINLAAGKHHSKPLQRAWGKYGSEKFTFLVLELTDTISLITREQHWIIQLNSLATQAGYNVAPNAGSILGVKRSPETIAKMSAALKGRVCSPEHIAAMVEGWKKRGPHSEETRAKIAASSKGRVKTPEERAKLSATLKGRVPSPQCLEAARKANKGRPIPDATKAALAKANRGRVRPDVAERSRQRWASKRKSPKGQLDLFTHNASK